MGKSKKTKLIYIFILMMGISSLVSGISACKDMFNRDGMAEMFAVISDIETYSDSDGEKHYEVYVEYEVEGKRYESILDSYMAGYHVGKEVEIYYDVQNPEIIQSKDDDNFQMIGPIIGLLFILFAGYGLFGENIKNMRKKRLQEKGTRIQAKYVETVYDSETIVNGKSPYYIICEWENPADNKKYIFKSESLWTDPETRILQQNITSFPIYFNEKNMRKYVIDISSVVK